MSGGVFRLTYRIQGAPHCEEKDLQEVTIGRHPNCEVQVSGEAISRFHAKIIQDDQGWSVLDLKSVNGTQVNDKNVTRCRLKDQDRITLGSLELLFGVVKEPESVVYESSEDAPLVTQSINVDEFKQLLERSRSPGEPGDSGTRETMQTPVATAVAPSELEDSSATYNWALPVVSKASQSLLSCHDLDEMLNCVMDLVFDNLPSERGCIFLYDEEKQEQTMRVMRTQAGIPQERFTISTTVTNQTISEKTAVLCSDTAADDRFSEQHSIIFSKIASVMCAPLYAGEGGQVGGYIYIDTRNVQTPFRREHLEVLTTLAMLSSVALEQAKLRENVMREKNIRSRLERYCPAVVDTIIDACEEGLPDVMIAAEMEVTVLFLDLSGFTTLSEDLAPAEVTQLLNDVFGRFTDAVFEFTGTLDKFMGDGMMAIFGAPVPMEDHADRAVRAALRMQEHLEAFNSARGNDSGLRMRIGINSGLVTAGDIGSPERKDYTVIGDVVNVASRLESQVAVPGQIIIGPRTKELVTETICCKELEPTVLKGKSKPVSPHLVLGEA